MVSIVHDQRVIKRLEIEETLWVLDPFQTERTVERPVGTNAYEEKVMIDMRYVFAFESVAARGVGDGQDGIIDIELAPIV